MKPILILSAQAASGLALPYRYAHISIINPGGQDGWREWPVSDDPNRVALLRVEFWDKRDGEAEWHGNNVDGYIPTAEQMAPIAPFVHEWMDKVDGFVINCAAGVSRSAGVAAGISEALGLDPAACYVPPHNPNPVVRGAVARALDALEDPQ